MDRPYCGRCGGGCVWGDAGRRRENSLSWTFGRYAGRGSGVFPDCFRHWRQRRMGKTGSCGRGSGRERWAAVCEKTGKCPVPDCFCKRKGIGVFFFQPLQPGHPFDRFFDSRNGSGDRNIACPKAFETFGRIELFGAPGHAVPSTAGGKRGRGQ